MTEDLKRLTELKDMMPELKNVSIWVSHAVGVDGVKYRLRSEIPIKAVPNDLLPKDNNINEFSHSFIMSPLLSYDGMREYLDAIRFGILVVKNLNK